MAGLRILVVDDEPDLEALMRQKFRRQIREREVELHFARDGGEALARIAEVPDLDVILTDINMPGMDGLTLLARVKEMNLQVGTVIVSAYGDMGNIRTAMNRGAFDFLLKPIDFTDLESTVQRSATYVRQLRESASTHRQLLAIRQELEVAGAIQRSILPVSFPSRREVAIAARMEPARQIGGDFYDAFTLADGRIGFLIADVSGKGVPAALYMAVCRTLFLAVAQTQGNSVSGVMAAANAMLCNQDMQCMFVTLLYGVLTPTTGELELCSGGHEPPYVRRAAGGIERISLPRNLALGVEADFGPFVTHRLELAPGDQLLVYTDGLTEAENPEKVLFGRERLEAALAGTGGSAADLVGRFFEKVRAFAGGATQSDDLTLLAVQYLGRPDLLADFRAEIPCDIQRMADALASFEAYCGNRGIEREEFLPVLLCAEEVLTNVIAHGAPTDGSVAAPIVFTAGLQGGRITLAFEDQGREFDPLQHPEPNLQEDPDTRAVGGLGIFLTRKHMDRVDYRREGGRNILTISRPVLIGGGR